MDERKWTDIAIKCLNRGCICKGCPMQELIETKCNLKQTVIELVKRWGIPNGYNASRFSKTDEY